MLHRLLVKREGAEHVVFVEPPAGPRQPRTKRVPRCDTQKIAVAEDGAARQMSFYADVYKSILEERVITCVVLSNEALKSSARSGLCRAGKVMFIVLCPIGASEGLCAIEAVAFLGRCHAERSGSDHPGCPEGQRGCPGLLARLEVRGAP